MTKTANERNLKVNWQTATHVDSVGKKLQYIKTFGFESEPVCGPKKNNKCNAMRDREVVQHQNRTKLTGCLNVRLKEKWAVLVFLSNDYRSLFK